MLYFRRTRFFRLVVFPLTLMAFLSACHKWVPLNAPVEDAVAASRLESVRITMSDGRILELKNAIVEGDSVIGFAPQRIALPVEQVQTVERRKTDALGIVGLIVGIGVASNLVVLAVCGDIDPDTRCD